MLVVHHEWTKKLSGSATDYAAPLEAAMFDLTKGELPPGLLSAALTHVVFTDDPSAATFATMNQWSTELGVIREPISLDGLIDTSILGSLQ
jgi:hypothetical protein